MSIKEARTIKDLNIELTKPGTKEHFWLHIISDGMGSPIRIPIMVAKGIKEGPTLGITAAVHGNELNGISVIQRLFNEIDPSELSGSIVGVPVANVPAFIRKKRRFNDGVDLNHIMPGVEDGRLSGVYAYRFMDRIIKHLDVLLDLHTASFGRINSYYARADMEKDVVKELALLQNTEIIVHNPPNDGTLRGAADELGIPAITLEVGNPNTFQRKMIRSGVTGIHNALSFLKMTNDPIVEPEKPSIICQSSKWLYTDVGGLLSVHVELRQVLKKGEEIAVIRDVFGNTLKRYYAPYEGIVIGKSVSPVNQTGGRILHIGKIKTG